MADFYRILVNKKILKIIGTYVHNFVITVIINK